MKLGKVASAGAVMTGQGGAEEILTFAFKLEIVDCRARRIFVI